MAEGKRSNVEVVGQVVQVVSVVVGVVISVLSFSSAQRAAALREELEAERPFLELRQKLYQEALQTAGVLANPDGHTGEELREAETRFWELYWAELSLVEGRGVEKAMIDFGRVLREGGPDAEARRKAAYRLSHALRDSLFRSWRIREVPEDFNP